MIVRNKIQCIKDPTIIFIMHCKKTLISMQKKSNANKGQQMTLLIN